MSAITVALGRKVRMTLTLDADLVERLGADEPASLSAAVNAVLRAEVERRARVASVRQLADDLDALYGPPDPAAVAPGWADAGPGWPAWLPG
jgi:hypothetical protein